MTNILLIDNQALFQKAFAKTIDQMDTFDYIGAAETEDEAYEMFEKYYPSMVFIDLYAFGRSAIDICKWMKEKQPETKVYVVSAYCSMRLIQKSMMAGVEEYLLKPITSRRLKAVIEKNKLQEKEEDLGAQEIFLALEHKDYMEVCSAVGNYATSLFADSTISERKDKMKKLCTEIMNTVPGMDPAQRTYYLQKYEITKKTTLDSVLSYCYIMQIVTEVFRQWCVMKYAHMGKVFRYIDNNINNEISLPELADQAGISSGYLSRIFKKYYHISVVDYIHLKKIQMAKYYMASSEMNISDISFLLGYSEAGYFCKIFKKYQDMTPSAYLNQYIKNKKASA